MASFEIEYPPTNLPPFPPKTLPPPASTALLQMGNVFHAAPRAGPPWRVSTGEATADSRARLAAHLLGAGRNRPWLPDNFRRSRRPLAKFLDCFQRCLYPVCAEMRFTLSTQILFFKTIQIKTWCLFWSFKLDWNHWRETLDVGFRQTAWTRRHLKYFD